MAKRRSAAQKAATRRMIAANRSRRRAPTKARRRKPARRRAAPVARRRKRRVRRNPATSVGQRRTYARTAQMNPRRRRRVRRNQLRGGRFTMNQVINDIVMPSAIGAVGAIANDALFTYLPLPMQFKTPGFARYASKGVTAVLMTWLASFVVQKRTAVQLGVGALNCLTAEMASVFRKQTMKQLAQVAMEGRGMYTMGYYNPALPAGGGENGNNMGV